MLFTQAFLLFKYCISVLCVPWSVVRTHGVRSVRKGKGRSKVAAVLRQLALKACRRTKSRTFFMSVLDKVSHSGRLALRDKASGSSWVGGWERPVVSCLLLGSWSVVTKHNLRITKLGRLFCSWNALHVATSLPLCYGWNSGACA
jgi:hypothetical protein